MRAAGVCLETRAAGAAVASLSLSLSLSLTWPITARPIRPMSDLAGAEAPLLWWWWWWWCRGEGERESQRGPRPFRRRGCGEARSRGKPHSVLCVRLTHPAAGARAIARRARRVVGGAAKEAMLAAA